MGCLAERLLFKKGTDRVNENEVPNDLWSISIDDIEGKNKKLREYTDNKKAFIFVNVACK